MPSSNLKYLSGFANEFATEAISGALPSAQNSPQRHPLGLYTEQLSGTAFTAPRATNRRTWTYRIRPSVSHPPFQRIANGLLRSGPFVETEPTPNQLRWDPLPIPTEPTDFVAGLVTLAGCGDPVGQAGVAIHLYACNRSMQRKYFYTSDGELLLIPQSGGLKILTELGRMELQPGEICVIPRGMKFRVELDGDSGRGYVCENYGSAFRLPDLGPIGANGLANPRDFLTPVAAYEDIEGECELVTKFQGGLWQCKLDHSPLDVVGWHGNFVPYKYSLDRFNCINSVSYDHPDPSIYTVLTAPSAVPGTANCDFVIFPPRWMVAEHTFRPPWFHRNCMSELMGLVRGEYDAKAAGFVPGGASLHNCMAGHGPDAETFRRATEATLAPQRLDDSMAFMLETQLVFRPTRFAMETQSLQAEYYECWQDLKRSFVSRDPQLT